MTCWLKFDTAKVGVDSSWVRHVRIYGDPQRIPENTGYYQPIEKWNTIGEIIRQRTEKMQKSGKNKYHDNFGIIQETEEEKEKGNFLPNNCLLILSL
jgi:hypothetical protein